MIIHTLLLQANILYRALSPELVCLDNRGYAMLMEFRLAKLGLESSSYTLCGTPEYLAPEQVRNQGHGKVTL
jgi:serine/threonine protein kinase